MLVGGARSGKTFFIVRAIVIRALRAPGSRHVIFRLRFNACKASIWLDTFQKVMRLCFSDVKVDPHKQEGYVTFPNGSEIWFAGLDDKERVEKILGMEFATIYFGECSQIPYSTVLTALTRLAQKCPEIQNRAYFDLNPTTTKHWTHALFIEHMDPVSRMPLPKHIAKQYGWMRMNPVDNKDNIDPDFIEALESMPERVRKRFLEGSYVAEIDGALWTPETLERQRIESSEAIPEMRRIVISVDPSGASGKEDERSDEVGITVCGEKDNKGYLLADLSGRYGPERWASIVAQAFRTYDADKVIGEINYGGDMVRAVIQGKDKNIPFDKITATRGKVVRAEPIAALYEQGKIYHCGRFQELEDQYLNFSVQGYLGERSPDRADSAIWGFHYLLLGPSDDGLLQFYTEMNHEREARAAKEGKL